MSLVNPGIDASLQMGPISRRIRPLCNGGYILDQVVAFIRRFVLVSEEQAIAIALFVAHTHAFDAAETTPYLSITSAEKQSGKTRLLEVLNLLAAKPWLTGSASKGVLVRKIDREQPTLLLDESDAAFSGDKEYAEALRAVLNSGHRRGGVASLCVSQGASIAYHDFRVFSPKVIAGIGKLPDTVADRSIPIRMKRRAPNEQVERFRERLVRGEAREMSEQLARWLCGYLDYLRDAQPALPDALSDRQQDSCEPLLAIADLASGNWPQRAREALVSILNGDMAADDSIGVRLLWDVRAVFDQKRAGRLTTARLIDALCKTNPQWDEFNHGKPLSPAALARLLRRYGIQHTKLRIGRKTVWGYERRNFDDGWMRYPLRKVEQWNNPAVARGNAVRRIGDS